MGVLIFILGAAFGSFFLVVGTRLPKKEDIVFKRSSCEYCQHVLSWYELIPIFSFLFLKGKCHNCHKKLDKEYIVIEIITSLLFLVGYLYYGLCLEYLVYLISISVAMIIFISDFKYMIILDSPLIVGTILLSVVKYFEVGLIDMLYSYVYGIILFVIMYLIKLFGDIVFKKESLGGGDIKLCFFIGFMLGYPNKGLLLGLVSLVFSAFLALPYALTSVYLNKKNELPYGPFLISSSIIILVFIEKFSKIIILFS